MHHYDTGSQIVLQTGLLLAGMRAEIQAGHASSVFNEEVLKDLDTLLDQFRLMRRANFTNQETMQKWLHRVADLLPVLWD